MRRRNQWLGGATLFALGLALGLALAVTTSHRAADSRPLLSSSAPSGAAAAAPTPAVPSPRPPSADTRLTTTVGPDGNAGGRVVIPVPPPEPEICAPVHITVVVGQTTVIACRSANYDGPITMSVANPTIASVTTSNSRMLPRYLVITGRMAGTTIVRVSYPNGPTTSYPITVSPA
ncbi:MAG TPA: pilus assembly protein N-terminal domain-containing protein [Candidatus Dormibacteraeota bacterium]|nr:pilus assembly protein N-terminal domain-containing protein [Candidatus Dormibacteraeota bacterium]